MTGAAGSATRPAPAHRGAGPVADPVGAAVRLRATVAGRIAELTGGPSRPSPPPGEPIATGGEVYVGWYAALEAHTCPVRYRAGGEDGWGFPGWTAATAAAAVGRAALGLYLDEGGPQRTARHPLPPPAPLDAVRAWMRAMGRSPGPGVGQWVAERLAGDDQATLAATAAGATRWLAGFLRVLGWPLPDGLALRDAGTGAAALWPWRPWTRAPVVVASGADARLGRVTGSGAHAIVVHRSTAGDDDRVGLRAAFEAAAATLIVGVVPASVLVVAGDTGERLRVPVDDDLLAIGADLALGVVHQRVRAAGEPFDVADAAPGPGCRHCPVADRCEPGRTWLSGPGRRARGLPVLP